MPPSCPLCVGHGGELLWRDGLCHVLLVDEPGYPGCCRVVLNRHVAEMTDLEEHEREHMMRVVFAVEREMRRLLSPAKINLASLGNQVPHVHWHVIPRWLEDRHFPAPIWSAPRRTHATPPVNHVQIANLRAVLEQLAP